MNVKLELSFDSIGELQAYLKRTTAETHVVTPDAPVSLHPAMANVQPAVGTAPQEPVAAPQVVPTPPTVAVAPASESSVSNTQPASATGSVPVNATEYTLDDLARAGASLVDMGRQQELPGVLARFGVAALPELPKERYAELATVLREMGARI